RGNATATELCRLLDVSSVVTTNDPGSERRDDRLDGRDLGDGPGTTPRGDRDEPVSHATAGGGSHGRRAPASGEGSFGRDDRGDGWADVSRGGPSRRHCGSVGTPRST